MNQPAKLSVSIVIATADRPRPVLDCVMSFRDQIPADVEVIIVDAGVEEPVDEIALKTLWPNSRVIQAAARNASAQRNLGVQVAGSQGLADRVQTPAIGSPASKVYSPASSPNTIIIFLDDDTLVNPGWWPALLEPLADSTVAVVQGGIHSSKTPHLRQDRGGYVKWYGEPVPCLERGAEAPRELDWPMTTNMAVRKAVYEAVGGLEPAFVIYDEDVDFGLRVRRAGWRIVHEPAASVYHYGHRMWRPPATKRGTFRKGRNRTLMLVRNFNYGPILWRFLLIYPVIVTGRAAAASARTVWHCFGHAAAEVLGTLWGVLMARRHRP